MKKSYLLLIVFIASLAVIAFYIMRNSQITDSIQELRNIQQISYELELLTQKQRRALDKLRVNENYDEITEINQQFENQFLYFSQLVEQTKGKKLKRLLLKVKEKSAYFLLLEEDLKTDTAVLKNSKIWITSNYETYLSKIGTQGVDAKLLTYIFKVVNSKNKIINVKEIDADIYKSILLKAHLDMIYKKQKSIESIEKELKANDLVSGMDRIILHTLKKLNELHGETKFIIEMLLLSSVFLLFFGLIIYVRELLVSLQAQRLKNDLQQFVDALNVSAIVSKTDPKGMITYVNDKFCAVSGYSEKELIGQPHNIIRHPNMKASVFALLWEKIAKKEVFQATIENRTKSGASYFVDTSIIPLLDLEGKIVEYLAVRYEVTDLVKSRDMAVVAEKAKTKFLSNMSHELRTPLNAIVGFSSILSRVIKDEKQSRYLENILESSNNLLGLINDILDLSKLQSGNFSLDYNEFNVYEKVHILLETFTTLVEKSQLNIELNIDIQRDVTLNGDWLRISQIVTNLVSNAIKFSPKGKAIVFNLKYENKLLKMNVIDNGIGLSEEAQKKIFKPFEQADSSTTRLYGGTGLGLSIVLSLIEQMEGKISLESREGFGSDFEVEIPLERVQRTKMKIEDELSQVKVNLYGHILIAEDNLVNQKLIGVFMEELGLTYKIAKDGVEAVDMFGAEKFDLVLMDENMPNLNGTEAMRRIHSLYGHEIPIVALTANAMNGDREKFLEAGMNEYISKPIDDRELYKVIKKCLDQ